MRLLLLAFTVFLTTLTGLPPVKAEPMSETDRYELCSKSPQNVQCSNYQVPIALDARPGEAGACVLTVNSVENKTICKLVVNKDTIAAYYEIGDSLEVLGGKKASREMPLSPGAIKAIRYREGTKDNTTGRVLNTLFFGLGGLFGTRNKKVSELSLDYTAQAASAPEASSPRTASTETLVGTSAPKVEAGKTEAGLMTLAVVVRRNTGEALRLQLEQLTGLKATVPQVEKQPEPEKQPSEPQTD